MAQHWHYSQYNFTEQRINPGQIAHSRYARASLNYRSQQTGGDFNINSNFLELTHPLLHASTGQPWSAVSINFHRDRSAGIFITTEAALSYALSVRLSSRQRLGVGARALYQARSVDFSGFFTGSQYIPDRGFSTSISTGEQLTNLRANLTTFSTGLHWQREDKRGLPEQQFGFSLYDLNRPPDSFLSDRTGLPTTLTVTGGWQWWKKKDLHVYSDVLVMLSAGNVWTNFGVRLQKELQPRTPKNTDRVELLLRYVPMRSGILGIQFHQKDVSFGLSYDFPVLYRNVGNLGALEVALQIRKLVLPKNKRTTAKKKTTVKPTPVMAKKTEPKREPARPTPPAEAMVASPAGSEQADSLLQATPPKGSAQPGVISQEMQIVKTRQIRFHFEFNSADLDDEAEELLAEFRAELEADPDLRLRVEGFTDNVGHDHFNQRLSLKRAYSVCDFLKRAGIDPDRLEAIGRGEEQPLNENSNEAERALNRRVVLTFYRRP